MKLIKKKLKSLVTRLKKPYLALSQCSLEAVKANTKVPSGVTTYPQIVSAGTPAHVVTISKEIALL